MRVQDDVEYRMKSEPEPGDGTWMRPSDRPKRSAGDPIYCARVNLPENMAQGRYPIVGKDGKHLHTETIGKLDHHLTGAAWAALHEASRIGEICFPVYEIAAGLQNCGRYGVFPGSVTVSLPPWEQNKERKR